MRIGLTARLSSGAPGGVEQVLIGLAHGLSRLEADADEFQFVTSSGEDAWLRPYIGGACSIVSTPPQPSSGKVKSLLKRTMPAAEKLARVLPPLPGLRAPRPSVSDGTLERLGVDAVHFATQDAFLTSLPSIYQPHDLLHVHFPHFLTPRQREYRETHYPLHCERARYVVAMTTWGKSDLAQQLNLPTEKIRVVPWAPVVSAYEKPSPAALAKTAGTYELPEDFLFYPAQTFPHKNHLGLLEAISILRDRHRLRISVVCSGLQNDFFPRIARRMTQLGLSDQVKFVGFVTPEVVQCFYAGAKALIFPSHFEGWGMPICEAFAWDLPVACSNATSLPNLTEDAALLFDPNDPDEMADAVARLWEEEELRTELVRRGRRRVADFSWERSARLMRILYREASGTPLTAEDVSLLAKPVLV